MIHSKLFIGRYRSQAPALLFAVFTLGWQANPHSLAGEVSPPLRHYPEHASIIDVTRPPYAATGDGKTDDTASLQRAINEVTGQHKILYFPKGIYLISDTLKWPKQVEGRDNWGFTFLTGEQRDSTVIRLKDGVFNDPEKPRSLMWCGGFGSADWFHNYVENLTFDAGRGNPGAVGLQFYSNNSGAVRHCRFMAGEGSGLTGLDLSHRDMNGPLLVQHCEISGFRRGVTTGHSVNSQTFEHLTLRGQSEVGLANQGQTISIRGLISDNAVPVISTYGTLWLMEAALTGHGQASRAPAIVNFNGGHLMIRDLKTTGYHRALGDVSPTPDAAAAWRLTATEQPGTLGPDILEYGSQSATSPFPSPPLSLRLPVQEPPEIPQDIPSSWAIAEAFGADPSGKTDSSAALQRAVDSGATTVFLPGHYALKSTVILRGQVRRVIGTGGQINYGAKLKPAFRLGDGGPPAVVLEHFAAIHGGVEVDTRRTLVMRSVQDCDLSGTGRAAGSEWFLEDVVTHDLKLNRQKLWARQLNIENEGTHLTNEGGDVWILGFKTERGGTLIDTRGGGRSEVLGGFSYTTTAGKLAPMSVNDRSSVWAFFREICYNGDPFLTLIRETRGTETRTLSKSAGHTLPYSGRLP